MDAFLLNLFFTFLLLVENEKRQESRKTCPAIFFLRSTIQNNVHSIQIITNKKSFCLSSLDIIFAWYQREEFWPFKNYLLILSNFFSFSRSFAMQLKENELFFFSMLLHSSAIFMFFFTSMNPFPLLSHVLWFNFKNNWLLKNDLIFERKKKKCDRNNNFTSISHHSPSYEKENKFFFTPKSTLKCTKNFDRTQ